MNTISIVIPAYNRAALIGQTLDNVFEQLQDVPDLDIVVVDDGSTDETAVVAEAYRARGPVRVIRQDNAGPAAARNRGIAESKGRFVAFLDSDDVWRPGKLRRQLRCMQQDDVALVFTGTETRNADLSRILRTCRPTPDQRGDAFSGILDDCFVKTSSVLVRRDILQKAGGFNETLIGPEDWELFARILHDHRVDFLEDPCVIYRSHDGSMQMNIERWVENDLRAMDLIFSLPRARGRRRSLRDQRFRIFSEAGAKHFYRGDHQLARPYLTKSLRYRMSGHILAILLKTFLPADALRQRRARRYGQEGACL